MALRKESGLEPRNTVLYRSVQCQPFAQLVDGPRSGGHGVAAFAWKTPSASLHYGRARSQAASSTLRASVQYIGLVRTVQ